MIELPSVTPASFRQYLMTHKDRVYRYVIREINNAIDMNLSVIQLFQIGKSKEILELKKYNYRVILEAAMDFFVTEELYEDAAICRDLIFKLKDEEKKGTNND